MNKDAMRERVLSKGVRAEDIKHAGLLTDQQIGDIPLHLVYAWVKTGAWKQRDFLRWCKAVGLEERA